MEEHEGLSALTHIRAGYHSTHNDLLLKREISAALADYHRLLFRCYLYQLIEAGQYIFGCITIATWESDPATLHLFTIIEAKRQLAEQVLHQAQQTITTC